MIPLLQNWLSEIKLKLYSEVKITLYNLIVLLSTNRIKIISISSVYITCFSAIIKSMLLAFVFRNSFQLLHKWQKTYESKNQILTSSFYNFLATQVFLTNLSINDSILLELSMFSMA